MKLAKSIRLPGPCPRLLSALAVALTCGVGCGKGGTSSLSEKSASLPSSTATSSGVDASSESLDGAMSIGPDAGPFVPDTAYVYVAKVKNILIGLPPTDEEVQSVVTAADPVAQLQALIKNWMAVADPNAPAGTTYYEEKMRVFFELATQQTQISATSFSDQVYPGQIDVNGSTQNRLAENAIESFARTMVREVVDGTQPLTQVTTTTTFMMTTALMETYAFLDGWQVNDSGTVVDHFAKANPGLLLTVGSAATPIASTVDPSDPNFMHWSEPDVAAGGAYSLAANQADGCATDPITYPATGLALHYLLYGAIVGRTVAGTKCNQFGGTKTAPQIGNAASAGANDFDDWRLVTIRQPAAGETTTPFYNLPALRQSSTLVLNTPRVGFFTTPAFFANWQTNTSNTMRVTMNQTLIVALGAMFDGIDGTVPPSGPDGLPPGLDIEHAAPATACYVCHRLLDPTRSILSATYSWNYHAQDTSSIAGQLGAFAFQGVVASPQNVFDLGKVLSTHPLFAQGWTQKLCEYANSQPCATADPEFLRIVKAFQSGGYVWKDLVVDLLSSPITTGAMPTESTAQAGEIIAVSRRDHLCAAINFRFGFSDICALLPTTVAVSPTIAQIAKGLPSDGYGRGAVAPVLPNIPTLFYRAGTENICEALSQLVIDAPTATKAAAVTWSSTNSAAAITDFATTLMGLVPSDPRYAQAVAILTAHHQAALSQGATATHALQSTFIAACLAPSAVSVGM